MSEVPSSFSWVRSWHAFVVVFVAAFGFALATNHVWEDYYITYRSSKHLATGYGLVFNRGERLHTFTSPLGVLLPALACKITANNSDVGALWIFRGFCCAALGGAAALLTALARRRAYGGAAVAFLAVALATDAKSLDFTINGMETAFMLLFLAYAIWAHLRPTRGQWAHLGAAWAGLMWTRPDSFIYVGLIGAGFWLFNDSKVSGRTRREIFVLYVKAALLTTALYAPWLGWARWYYGSPIPHTIAAKGGLSNVNSAAGLPLTLLKLPVLAWTKFASLELTFLPSYFMLGGWPSALVVASRILATVLAYVWLIPRVRLEARVTSFAFFGAHVYLTYFPYFPFPWYVPSTTLLAFVCIGSVLSQLSGSPAPWLRRVAGTVAIVFLIGSVWFAWEVARQVGTQQRIVEDGNRRRIGEWLKAHARPGDAVFMEPLGYISFFSGLKTYDYPGMSSREMVAARKKYGEEWGRLLFDLAPRWAVLRPFEVDRINSASPGIIGDHYQAVQDFDRSRQVAALDVYGLPYLTHDSHFTVYELVRPFGFETEVIETKVPYPVTKQMVDGVNMSLMHAPSRMTVKVPRLARRFSGHFCIMAGAWEGPGGSDGAAFSITLREGGNEVPLLERTLDPGQRSEDRGLQSYAIELPAGHSATAELIFEIRTGATANRDWTCWDLPDFR